MRGTPNGRNKIELEVCAINGPIKNSQIFSKYLRSFKANLKLNRISFQRPKRMVRHPIYYWEAVWFRKRYILYELGVGDVD